MNRKPQHPTLLALLLALLLPSLAHADRNRPNINPDGERFAWWAGAIQDLIQQAPYTSLDPLGGIAMEGL